MIRKGVQYHYAWYGPGAGVQVPKGLVNCTVPSLIVALFTMNFLLNKNSFYLGAIGQF
jgi:hypothetical protein